MSEEDKFEGKNAKLVLNKIDEEDEDEGVKVKKTNMKFI